MDDIYKDLDPHTPAPPDRLLAESERAGAVFSQCRTWRYALWRQWTWRGYANCVMFVGLNPSTADETQDDPTIRRCIGFAKRWGFDGLYMLNAFAFRATDPNVMKAAADPIGPGNNEALAYYRTKVGLIVAAWGKHGSHRDRGADVCRVLGRDVHCLAINGDGTPKHPLYIKGDAQPIRYHPSPAKVTP